MLNLVGHFILFNICSLNVNYNTCKKKIKKNTRCQSQEFDPQPHQEKTYTTRKDIGVIKFLKKKKKNVESVALTDPRET